MFAKKEGGMVNQRLKRMDKDLGNSFEKEKIRKEMNGKIVDMCPVSLYHSVMDYKKVITI